MRNIWNFSKKALPIKHYSVTERDKSVTKYILTKITDVKFANNMQNTSNKDSIRQSRSHSKPFT